MYIISFFNYLFFCANEQLRVLYVQINKLRSIYKFSQNSMYNSELVKQITKEMSSFYCELWIVFHIFKNFVYQKFLSTRRVVAINVQAIWLYLNETDKKKNQWASSHSKLKLEKLLSTKKLVLSLFLYESFMFLVLG